MEHQKLSDTWNFFIFFEPPKIFTHQNNNFYERLILIQSKNFEKIQEYSCVYFTLLLPYGRIFSNILDNFRNCLIARKQIFHENKNSIILVCEIIVGLEIYEEISSVRII